MNVKLIKYADPSRHHRFLHLTNECWQRCKYPNHGKQELTEVVSLFKRAKGAEARTRGLRELRDD